MNIRSVRKNLDSFENYLNLLNHNFTVIGLSETWLSKDDYDLSRLSGYNFIGHHRSDRIGGGVAIGKPLPTHQDRCPGPWNRSWCVGNGFLTAHDLIFQSKKT